MAEHQPDLHPDLVELWQEYIRRERKWAEDPTNGFAYRSARAAFESYDRRRRELFALLHPDEAESR